MKNAEKQKFHKKYVAFSTPFGYNIDTEKSSGILHITTHFSGGTTMSLGKIGLFAAGLLFGTAGIKILTSKDAKKVYTHTTAAVLRAKEDIMTTVTNVRENAGDIVADAREINDKRKAAAKAEVIEDDCTCPCCEEEADTCCTSDAQENVCPCCGEDACDE